MEEIISAHISKNPDVCGGRACITGHRIRVMDIVVWYEFRKYSADEIVAMFPGITLGDVHAALMYYFDHPQEIQKEFSEDEEAMKTLSMQPSKLDSKLSA
jgi:uncharacterized protein (DUF433 family)